MNTALSMHNASQTIQVGEHTLTIKRDGWTAEVRIDDVMVAEIQLEARDALEGQAELQSWECSDVWGNHHGQFDHIDEWRRYWSDFLDAWSEVSHGTFELAEGVRL